jgi:hypothetical protein
MHVYCTCISFKTVILYLADLCFIMTYLPIKGVRRIGLTSLNPMVCLSSQSESDPKMKKAIRSDPKKCS